MPWKEASPVDQRTQFIADFLRDALSITELCALYGVSRKTGYKWIDRYLRHGPAGLEERSRRPRRAPNQTAAEIVDAILDARRRHPTWGGKKLLALPMRYIVIFTRNPEAFSFGTSPEVGKEHLFPVFIYFSLTVLSTIGFGDITPLTLPARYAAVAVGIIGQFYLGVLVARLVGMQMSQVAIAATSAKGDDRRKEDRVP